MNVNTKNNIIKETNTGADNSKFSDESSKQGELPTYNSNKKTEEPALKRAPETLHKAQAISMLSSSTYETVEHSGIEQEDLKTLKNNVGELEMKNNKKEGL